MLDEGIVPAEGLPEPAGMVGGLTSDGWPAGYRYGVTRYADIILHEAFPQRFRDLQETLTQFRIDIDELTRGGGSRATHTSRFDSLLEARGWGKRNIDVSTALFLIPAFWSWISRKVAAWRSPKGDGNLEGGKQIERRVVARGDRTFAS